MTGNSTNVVFQKDMTTIEDLFLEGEPTVCRIQTKELRALMDEWIQKRQEFLKQKQNQYYLPYSKASKSEFFLLIQIEKS